MRKRMRDGGVGRETLHGSEERQKDQGDRREQGENNRPGETDPLLRLDKQKGEGERQTGLPSSHCSLPRTAEMLLTPKKREEGQDGEKKDEGNGFKGWRSGILSCVK